MAQESPSSSWGSSLKRLFVGKARTLTDHSVFHQMSLVAFFAWVGLGADGLSSASYGPEEAFHALHGHPYLAIFIAFASAVTIWVISASYSNIIEVFPSGGGGYLVASKLLGSGLGMVSGSALLVDYILTITISIASGVDAVFSFLPNYWSEYKLITACIGVGFMIMVNLRGVRESVIVLLPIFMVFIITHAVAFIAMFASNGAELPSVAVKTTSEWSSAVSEFGVIGTLLIILRAYTLGAGTYTGIEAVSNAVPILREPRVETAKKTMRYMAISLSVTVVCLIMAYALYEVKPVAGKTLNAVVFTAISSEWGEFGHIFALITLISEAAILFIAAQAGFLGGPRILATMAADRWAPSRFAILSDRLVTQNGVVLVGVAALIMMIFTNASVKYLVVLYSINVFFTFTTSQIGMVKHWFTTGKTSPKRMRKLFVNGFGFLLTAFVLVSVVYFKFLEGGYVTVIITGSLALIFLWIQRHYKNTGVLLGRLNTMVKDVIEEQLPYQEEKPEESLPQKDLRGRTAVFLVNGFSGLGLHTLFTAMRMFKGIFTNYVFVHVGIIDAGNFKGVEELEALEKQVKLELHKYVRLVNKGGAYGEVYWSIGTDVVAEVEKLAPIIVETFPNAMFFGGQLVFPNETPFDRLLHNYTVFAVQRRLYYQGVPVIVLPVKV